MRPTLLCIDANNLILRRYFSRPQGGFMVDGFEIDADAVRDLGSKARSAELEEMRQPTRKHHNVPHSGRTA